jgi:hypothetical protein
MSTIYLGIFFLHKDFDEDFCVVVVIAAFGRNDLVSDTGTFHSTSPTNHRFGATRLGISMVGLSKRCELGAMQF